MGISEACVRRPVGVTLLTLALIAAGIVAYTQLAVSALPQIDFPTLVVATQLPGASAEVMAQTVTTPLERALGQMPSLRQMTSVSSFGASQITLQFELTRKLGGAEQDVQAALATASNLLPKTLPAPPTYTKSNPADAPILTLAVQAANRPIQEVHDYADSVLAQRISQLGGVGLVSLAGSQKPAVRVAVDAEALAATGLTLEDVRTALAQANVNAPKGTLEGPRRAMSVATDDQLSSSDAFGALVLAYRNGAALRLRDVADVREGVENAALAAWADGQRAILLQVQRQPGANILEVTRRVHALLRELRASAPAGMAIEVLADRTLTTAASLHDVQMTLALTVALVILVILVFLQSARATLIPAVTVPLSLLATLVVMQRLGFSLDNLSLMALTVSTGLVVDDAIVMVEHIARHIEAGTSPQRAAISGARQMGFTILSLTVSMVAVLLPLLLMDGVIGRLFFAFSVTLAAAIVASAVLSVTLTPMMCAQLLRPHAPGVSPRRASSWAPAALARMSQGAERAYGRALQLALHWRRLTLGGFWLTVLLTAALAWHIPKGFLPEADTGLLLGATVAPPDVSFAHMAERQQALAQALGRDVDVAHVASFIGSDGVNPTLHTGRLNITLVPHAQRSAQLAAIVARLLAAADAVADLRLYLQPVSDLQLAATQSRTQYQLVLEGADTAALALWAPRLQQAMAALPELVDIASDEAALAPGVYVDIDRDAAGRLGVSVQAVDDVLYDAFGQRFVSTIYTQLNQYRVILGLADAGAGSAEASDGALQRLYVPGAAGPVPLTAVARLQPVLAPQTVSRQGQFPAVTLSFNLAPGASLSAATAAIEGAAAALQMPPHVRWGFTGTAEAYRTALAHQGPLIAAAIAVVYVVLGVLYESAIHPLTILSALPAAGVGALVALQLCGAPFDVMALIGVILLIGIVKKNAIMMIDVALVLERTEHLPPHEAIVRAATLRFRPIMMTTLAALLGALPLALGTGVGSEMRRPLGLAIVGGLLVSQALTLLTTPAIYLSVGRLGARLRGGAAGGAWR